jgi:hypothetical protein
MIIHKSVNIYSLNSALADSAIRNKRDEQVRDFIVLDSILVGILFN